MPPRLNTAFASFLAALYVTFRPSRRQIVTRNLLPVFKDDYLAASQASRKLFKNFAAKLVDLWRFESGKPVASLFHEWTGWPHFEAAARSGRGILLLTAHLGNWEFGGPLLTERGIHLQVITLPEPGGLTQHRQERRKQWGIETLVIGEDPFSFLPLIAKLQAGAVIAVLVDRPWGPTAQVELFSKPFHASIGLAELARASGCALLPVYIPRDARGYSAHILPPINYDATRLRSWEEKQHLTQKIISAFADPIRQYPAQWYQFVPVWP